MGAISDMFGEYSCESQGHDVSASAAQCASEGLRGHDWSRSNDLGLVSPAMPEAYMACFHFHVEHA